jgi:hypothetical protein
MSADTLGKRFGQFANSRNQFLDLLGRRICGLRVVTKVSDVAKMLNRAPRRDIDHVGVSKGMVQIINPGIFLRDLYVVRIGDFQEMFFQHYTGHRTGGTNESFFCQVVRSVKLRVEEVSLHELPDSKSVLVNRFSAALRIASCCVK